LGALAALMARLGEPSARSLLRLARRGFSKRRVAAASLARRGDARWFEIFPWIC